MSKTLLIAALVLLAFCLEGIAGGNENGSLLFPAKSNSTLQFKNAGLSFGDEDAFSELKKRRKKKRKKGKGKKGGDMAFDKGKFVIGFGYGVPNLTKSLYNSYKSYYGYKLKGSGPFHFDCEYGIAEKFGIGLSINQVSAKVSWEDAGQIEEHPGTDSAHYTAISYESGFKFNAIAFNIRGNFHFVRTESLDIYTGMGIGYNNSKSKYYTDNPDDYWTALTISSITPIGLEFSAGIRFYFTENIGAYMEIGPAKSLIQGGLVLKF